MNPETQIHNVLSRHPGVRETAVVRDHRNTMMAFVVPEDTYIDDVLGRKSAEHNKLDRWRKVFDLTQLAKSAAAAPVGFNTLGWNSSYTRQPIPADHMREWVQTTVADILSLRPRTLYEIGCGTGMLLTQIAPRCDRYVAVDSAPAVVSRLREQLQKIPPLAECVQVMERMADNFEGLGQNSFDTVVINSVAQYFPSVAYLTRVLDKAIEIAKEGAHVFVGDVPNLALLPVFASSVALFQASDSISVRELREHIRRRIETEQQLVLSPAYFLWLQHWFSKVSRVEIQPRRDRADNEMSKYRYHAILQIGRKSNVLFDLEFLDWNEHQPELNEIRLLLQQHLSRGIGIKRIRNARLQKDLAMLEKLRTADPAQNVGQLRTEDGEVLDAGIHPQDLVDLGTNDLGFDVRLSWAACLADGGYDAVFLPKQSHLSAVAINWPEPERSEYVQFANAPGESKLRGELLDRLVKHCKENLSEEMRPAAITLVNTLANLIDGNVHGEALLRARSAVLEGLSDIGSQQTMMREGH